MARLILTVLFCWGQLSGADGPARGALVIVGGGKLSPQIVEKFVSLAGGADALFVVIPTAGEDSQMKPEEVRRKFMDRFGVRNVTVLHTRDPKVADTADFTAPLRSAKAVWFEGGRQWRLVDSYLGTRTEREVKAVLARGGVVGGSSAGATIQGSYLVRGAVEGNAQMMSPGHEQGFGLFNGAAIDQHLITRHREQDLVPVIETHPQVLGVGIDESTAIVVQRNSLQVIGESKVAIYDNRDHDGRKYFWLSPGESYDLAGR